MNLKIIEVTCFQKFDDFLNTKHDNLNSRKNFKIVNLHKSLYKLQHVI